jgi:hypothetical protein
MWREAAAALLGAGFTGAACYAAGALLIRRLGLRDRLRRPEQVPLAFVLGAALVHLSVFAALALHVANRPLMVTVLGAVIAAAAITGAWRLPSKREPPLPGALRAILAVSGGAFLVLYLVNAWAPEASPDGSGYHLALAARYLRAGGFERPPASLFAAFSGGVDMLFLPAFAIGRHSAGALVHFCFLVALPVGILAYGRRIGKPWAGAAAALLTFLSPVAGKDGTAAYVDVAAAAIVFAAFHWLEVWEAERAPALLVPPALLAGYAFAAKYTAAIIVVYLAGFVLLRTRRWRPLAIVTAGFLVMAAPWLIRNAVWYQNPMAPAGNALFPNPHFYIQEERELARYFRTYGMASLGQVPLEVTARGSGTGGLIGPVFLLAPLGLLSLRYAAGRRVLVAGAVLLAVYPLNIGARFLIPWLPFASLGMALAAGERRIILAALMAAHTAASWPAVVKRYAPDAWKLDQFPLRAALRIQPPDDYLRSVHRDYVVARMIEDHVPPGERVLAMNGVAEAYTSRDVLVSFTSASHGALADTVNMGWRSWTQPLRARVFRFPAASVRGLRVVQTEETQDEQWNVHELRILHHGRELARRPEWRITARPNPWDAAFAFDHSPVTRWRSWEGARPGMYLEVDLARPESVDEVRMETSPDFVRVRFQLEAAVDGGWRRIAGPPEDVVLGGPRQVRREAIREMHRRGVKYLLMRSGDWGARDFLGDPEGWGLRIVAQSPHGTLYRSVWP